MFTLSGAHVFPLYDAAVGGKEGAAAGTGPMRVETQKMPHHSVQPGSG